MSNRRQAISKKSNTVSKESMAGSISQFIDFNQEPPDFFNQQDKADHLLYDEEVLETFSNVHLVISGNSSWVDSGLIGRLSVVKLNYTDIKDYNQIPPIVHLKIMDKNQQLVFEYELPINPKMQLELGGQFSAVKLMKGQWAGFIFSTTGNKQSFSDRMKKLQSELQRTDAQINQLNQICKGIQDDGFENQLIQVVTRQSEQQQLDQLQEQAVAFREIMLNAGIDLEFDLQDPEILEVIQKILSEHDPEKPIEEPDAIFQAQLLQANKQLRRQKTVSRRKAVFKTNQDQLNMYEKNEIDYVKKLKKKEERIKNREDLNNTMSQIAQESEKSKPKPGQTELSNSQVQQVHDTNQKNQQKGDYNPQSVINTMINEFSSPKISSNISQTQGTAPPQAPTAGPRTAPKPLGTQIAQPQANENLQENLFLMKKPGFNEVGFVQPRERPNTIYSGQDPETDLQTVQNINSQINPARGVPRPPPAPPTGARGEARPPPAFPTGPRGVARPPPAQPTDARGVARPPPAQPTGARGVARPPPAPPTDARGVARPPPALSTDAKGVARPPTAPQIDAGGVARPPAPPTGARGVARPPAPPTGGRVLIRAPVQIQGPVAHTVSQSASVQPRLASSLEQQKNEAMQFRTKSQIGRSGLSFEDQLALTALLLKPVSSVPMPVSEKVLQVQNKGGNSKVNQMLSLSDKLKVAVHMKKKMIQMKKEEDSDDDSDSDSESDSDDD